MNLDHEAIRQAAQDLSNSCDLYDQQHPGWWLVDPSKAWIIDWRTRLGLKPGERLLIGSDRLILVRAS
jgi:hypothetical protein